MSQTLKTTIAVVGIDIGKNSFHIVGLDQRGAIALRRKMIAGPSWKTRFPDIHVPDRHGSLVGAHHLSRKLKALGH